MRFLKKTQIKKIQPTHKVHAVNFSGQHGI